MRHEWGSGAPEDWIALPTFPTLSVWSTVELTVRASGKLSVAFDGAPAGELTVTVKPSTSADFGFGADFITASQPPSIMPGNIDDVVVVVAR